MGFFKSVAIVTGIVGAGIAVFAQKRSAETGKDIKEVMTNLPEEMKDASGDIKQRLKGAAGDFKRAAANKEEEIDQLLAEEEEKLAAASDAPVEAGVLS